MARSVRVLLVLALVLAGCGDGRASLVPVPLPVSPSPDAPTVPAPDAIRVTLGIYSGRPDPTWTLRGPEAAAVRALLAELPPILGSPPEGGLGYHGFTLELPDRRLVAYRGFVATGGPTVLADPARRLERLLLELGRSRLSREEIDTVARDLSGLR